MPYVERVTKAGNTIEIERYFTSRYKKKGISRGDKVKPTKEEQEKVNTRQAERKLRILINANYGYGDYHLVLDYIRRKGEPDRTPEQMRQDIDVFLRECRKEYRKAGLEFKYIHVMEIGKKGARHHHLVVNKIDTEILQRCWYKAYEGHNRVKVFPLDDSGNYADLASYLIKPSSLLTREDFPTFGFPTMAMRGISLSSSFSISGSKYPVTSSSISPMPSFPDAEMACGSPMPRL